MSHYYDSFPWYLRAENEKQYLYIARHKENSPQLRDWSPEEIDYEMSFSKNASKLEIGHFTQNALEYFVEHYGKNYEHLYFNNATRIRDFSPLADLPNLISVSINWCRADKLWDMSNNKHLKNICIDTAKKMTYELSMIETCKSLENIMIIGNIDTPHTLKTLSCFNGLPNLRRIDLLDIKLENNDISFLDTLPCFEEFHFEPGMLTTEEIAYICAKFPNLRGRSLCAFTEHHNSMNDVRVCGKRKPSLDLPKQQKLLDKYILEFNNLVEKYKEELNT